MHVHYSLKTGGFLEDRPTYQHTETFDPFPFPACITDQSALRQRLAALGERLDAFRKERLAAHEFLTMTALYNVLERVRELEWAGRGLISPRRGEMSAQLTERGPAAVLMTAEPLENRLPLSVASGDISPRRGEIEAAAPLTPAERDIYDAGLISILKEIHDDIDRATFEAYGWQDLGERLVGRPGATMPSQHKSEDQEQAEEELLSRLVALNLERQEEEKRGFVRWLRPDYQKAKLGAKVAKPSGEEQLEADVGVIAKEAKPKWPNDGLAQIRIVRDLLAKAAAPAAPDEIAIAFDGRNSPLRRQRVNEVLETLVATGSARTSDEGGKNRYFVAR